MSVLWPERERLTHKYHVAIDAFQNSVSALRGLQSSQFDHHYKVAESHRVAVDSARVALQSHRDDHGC